MPACAQLVTLATAGGGAVDVYAAAPGPCATGYAVLTADELADLQGRAANNVLTLSYADGVAVSGAVASVWVLAWTLRTVRRSLD